MIKRLKNIKTILALVVVSLACILCFTGVSIAAPTSVDAVCNFSQKLVSVHGQDMDQTYNYVLEAMQDDAPMPEGTVDGKYKFSITGNQTHSIKLNFKHAGVFKYKAYMVVDQHKQYYTYDEEQYSIEAYAENVEPESLKIFFIYKNKLYEKVVDPSWTVTLDQPLPPDPPQPDPSKTGPQTFDFTYYIAGVGLAIFVISAILFAISSRKNKKQSK